MKLPLKKTPRQLFAHPARENSPEALELRRDIQMLRATALVCIFAVAAGLQTQVVAGGRTNKLEAGATTRRAALLAGASAATLAVLPQRSMADSIEEIAARQNALAEAERAAPQKVRAYFISRTSSTAC